MTRLARIAALTAVLLLALVPASRADHDTSAPIVSYTLSGTAGANGWFRSNVTVSWSATDPQGLTSATCPIAQQVTTEGTTTHTCTATSHGGTTTGSVTLRIDKTAPAVSGASAARGPDSNGWYNHPLAVSFAGTDAVSGVASCTTATYGGGDSASGSVSGTCTDVAGNVSAQGSFALKYDATPPVVEVAADRAPDGNGWYRKPVTVTFTGGDATSGVEGCTPAARYTGPDEPQVSVAGTCRDHAGNAAPQRGFSFKYDATPPKLTTVEATYANGATRVAWQKPADAVLVRIDRVPGVSGRKRTNVYRGTGRTFVDRTIRKGVRYRYELIVLDAAGNAASKAVTANTRPPLYAPAAGAVVRAPVVLRWERSPNARFYNVQLYRNGAKVLTTWPRTTRFRLPSRWRHLAKTQSLAPGRYRWLVWPAFGTLERPRYGRPLGSSTFRIR